MKNETIHLKANVYRDDGKYIGCNIGDNGFVVAKKDLEQALVLAVDEVFKWLEKEAYSTLVIESNGECEFITSKGATRIKSISELTELVRGKERTLDDVVKDL